MRGPPQVPPEVVQVRFIALRHPTRRRRGPCARAALSQGRHLTLEHDHQPDPKDRDDAMADVQVPDPHQEVRVEGVDEDGDEPLGRDVRHDGGGLGVPVDVLRHVRQELLDAFLQHDEVHFQPDHVVRLRRGARGRTRGALEGAAPQQGFA